MKPSDSPSGLASIIIPSCNPLESTRQCVTALVRHARRPWELIVVDHGSSDETSVYLASLRDDAPVPVTVIPSTTNRGVPAAIIQGLKAERGEYLVMVSNDVVVTDSWLDQLIALSNLSRVSLEMGRGDDITTQNAEHAERKTEEGTADPEIYFARRANRDVYVGGEAPSGAAPPTLGLARRLALPGCLSGDQPPTVRVSCNKLRRDHPPCPPPSQGGERVRWVEGLRLYGILPSAYRPLQNQSVSSGRFPIMPLHRSASRACLIATFAAFTASHGSGATGIGGSGPSSAGCPDLASS